VGCHIRRALHDELNGGHDIDGGLRHDGHRGAQRPHLARQTHGLGRRRHTHRRSLNKPSHAAHVRWPRQVQYWRVGEVVHKDARDQPFNHDQVQWEPSNIGLGLGIRAVDELDGRIHPDGEIHRHCLRHHAWGQWPV
jgi:hypothetical protein